MPHRFYDIQFGDKLLLTLLDTNILDLCGFTERCTLDFLDRSLTESTARFKIVLGHHPIVSASSKYNRRNFQGWLLEKFLCKRANAYIAGHSHHLERRRSEECDLDLFIVGGGGADLYAVEPDADAKHFALSSYGFLALTLEGERAK